MSKEVEAIKDFTDRNHLDFNEAVRKLLEMGLKYVNLENKYGRVDDREVWDNRYYFLKIESGYLYYRLRVKELLEEIKSLIMLSTSLAKDLETCYKENKENISNADERIKRLKITRRQLEKYIDTYIFFDEKKLEEKKYAEDIKVLESIKKTLKKYEETFVAKEEKQS